MKDKFTHDLIDSLSHNDKLQLDFDDFINEEELEKINIATKIIKKKTYEKIGINKIKKYKTKKFINVAASILLSLIIGTPVALAFMDKLYKYDKSSGSIIKSESPIYVLKEPITKKVGDGKITVTSFLVRIDEESIEIDESASNMVGYEKLKADIIVNGKNITDSTYEDIGSSWQKSTGRPYKSKKDDKFEYVITLMDKDKNTTEVKFDIELEEAKSVEEYNNNVPKDTKNNVVISAITKEEDNVLYAELMAIPSIDNYNFNIDWYGNHINENKGSNIFLVDANGKRVEGDYYIDDNKSNIFKFDISNMQRPFTIEVGDIHVSSSENKKSEVNLPKLKFGESIDYNKTINLYDEDNLLTKDSHNVLIKKISRKDVEKVDSIVLDIEYIDNKNSDTKLKHVEVDPNISWFGFGKFDFTSSSQDRYREDNYDTATICIYLNNMDDKDYKRREKARSVGFKMSANTYKIEGPWNIVIK